MFVFTIPVVSLLLFGTVYVLQFLTSKHGVVCFFHWPNLNVSHLFLLLPRFELALQLKDLRAGYELAKKSEVINVQK